MKNNIDYKRVVRSSSILRFTQLVNPPKHYITRLVKCIIVNE